MGNNKKENLSRPKLLIALISEPCVQISCGQNHTMALMASGKVFSWGAGTYGRLGLGDEQDKFTPETIELFKDKAVRQIYCGGTISLAVCAHQWVPDKDFVACMHCKDKFTMFNRRHHCRNCGGIFL